MKFAFVFAALLLLTAGFSLTAVEPASAQCVAPCGAVLVPAPNPIPLRRLVVRPAPVAVAPCGGAGCVSGAAAYAAPPPCGQGGCGGTAFVYFPKRVYAYWKQPGYTACYPGPGNCYWRRDCWYDSFGRRFCN
jgi:hypothetical protein